MTDYALKDSGARDQFSTGAQRDLGSGKGQPSLLSPYVTERDAKLMEKGATKYEPRNWERGMPFSRVLDSLERHVIAFKKGLRDEDHLAAIRFNAGALMHYEEMIERGLLSPELDDLPHYEDDAEDSEEVTAMLDAVDRFLASLAGNDWGTEIPLDCIRVDTVDVKPEPLRVYVAGPFSADTWMSRADNVRYASEVGLLLMKKGHHAHVPHAATERWHNHLEYEDFMALDLGIIRYWATALFYIAPSPGADREKALAEELGLPVFTSILDVPDLRGGDQDVE